MLLQCKFYEKIHWDTVISSPVCVFSFVSESPDSVEQTMEFHLSLVFFSRCLKFGGCLALYCGEAVVAALGKESEIPPAEQIPCDYCHFPPTPFSK